MADTKVWTQNFRLNNRNMSYNPDQNKMNLRRQQHDELEEFDQENYRWHHGNRLNAKIKMNRGGAEKHGLFDD